MPTIALLEPQIPQNTGNIARLCVVTGTSLHLVGNLGFEINDKQLKRAGMDYWKQLEVQQYSTVEQYVDNLDMQQSFLFSTKANMIYTEVQFPPNATLLFGNEGFGTADWIMQRFIDHNSMLRIPQIKGQRCLNLAVSVGIALYELLRQTNFNNLV